MIINYGYKDGEGLWLITIDTEKCDGCGKCVEACPYRVLQMTNNEYDPLSEAFIPLVRDEHRKRIKYSCSPCKPKSKEAGEFTEPCIQACPSKAISHSW